MQSSTSTTTSSTTTTAPSTTTTTEILNEVVSAYFIGNSLTNDTLGPISRGYRSFYVLATQADVTVRPLGWHIRCGSSLIATASNPDDVCVDPVAGVGTFTEAIPGEPWDFVVVQPYPGEGSTLASDIEVIEAIGDEIAESTEILILTGWPRHPEFDESWTATGPITEESPTTHSRAYFDTLVERLRQDLDQDVRLIPSGEVLYRIQNPLVSGEVEGLEDRSDLYRDEVHLTSLGQWLSGVTAASVLTGADPTTFGKPSSWYGDSADFSSDYIALARSVIAEVLSDSQ